MEGDIDATYVKEILGLPRYHKFCSLHTKTITTACHSSSLLSAVRKIAREEGWKDVSAHFDPPPADGMDTDLPTTEIPMTEQTNKPNGDCEGQTLAVEKVLRLREVAKADMRVSPFSTKFGGRTHITFPLSHSIKSVRVLNPPCAWALTLGGRVASEWTLTKMDACNLHPKVMERYWVQESHSDTKDSFSNTLNASLVDEVGVLFYYSLDEGLVQGLRIRYVQLDSIMRKGAGLQWESASKD